MIALDFTLATVGCAPIKPLGGGAAEHVHPQIHRPSGSQSTLSEAVGDRLGGGPSPARAVACSEAVGDRLGGGPSPARAVESRREAERRAVRAIIDQALGPEVQIAHDAAGAPHIPGLHISISHSRHLAVVAVSDRNKVGVDAEEWRPALARVASRFLSAQERAMFTRDEQLLTAWTIKEAVYKAAGSEAYEFATAIAIAQDLRSARVGKKRYVIETRRFDDTVISLAIPE